jgi:hypothetical protein
VSSWDLPSPQNDVLNVSGLSGFYSIHDDSKVKNPAEGGGCGNQQPTPKSGMDKVHRRPKFTSMSPGIPSLLSRSPSFGRAKTWIRLDPGRDPAGSFLFCRLPPIQQYFEGLLPVH